MKEHDKQAKAIDSFDHNSDSFSDDDRMALSTAIKEYKNSSESDDESKTSFPKQDDGKYKGFIGTPDSNSFDPEI